jgi:AcrR family transcriptional regulator
VRQSPAARLILGQVEVAQAPLRKDAARSRAAILTAARELFSSGREVPMYEIGRLAGVGQATLYRHFPDRSAIVAAISREHVERIEATAAALADDDHAILILLDTASEMLVRIHDLVGILRADAALAPVLIELRQRMRDVLDAALERSRGSHLLRHDLQVEDIVLVLNMINGALAGIGDPEERTAAARRALALTLDGLRQEPRTSTGPTRADPAEPASRVANP